MIIKHVAMRSPRKSSFGDLARYLSNPKDTSERVGTIRISHCHSDELTDATLEIMATQACNTRARGDKTYHLIVSFRAGEVVPDDVLAIIEDRVCTGLGFADHQRVSVVHHDTDNLHIHLAINKIHPERLTMHEPYLAYRTMADQCKAIELDFQLAPDNHQASKRGAASRAEDMERAAGIESLQGWIKRECLPQLQRAASWTALHDVLHRHGLVLLERGNGFIIQNSDGLAVKASSVPRDLSKVKLVARLGAFQAPAQPPREANAARTYQRQPLPSKIDTSGLYARYKAEQQNQTSLRTTALRAAREQRNHAINSAKTKARLKRSAIKVLGSGRLTKKLLYAQTHQTLLAELAMAQERYQRERDAISERHRPYVWQEWLQQQAKTGDKEALLALRANLARQALNGNIVTGHKRYNDISTNHPEHVTKKGTLIYRQADATIRDDGDKLSIATDANMEGLIAALKMASQRYGQTLTVAGSENFKEKIAQAAAAAKLTVRFTDPTLERRRLALLSSQHQKETSTSRTPHIRR
ncbi:relaxase/mobilization nuclease domain-containing protein [Alcaligenes faecalis]|uniref:TraI/MobA(P) family conjugative relaxase n=1 Tax=Alcaligenes faecalis TaxID=511 RepID=UPI0018D1CC66|nr:TraI/MobA(P) family conjugative relaxase [Alcaligenes faecalis]MBH0311769.1 relaxase/mobilization nuclease domain-containing protein [Alcaligenes faecalis]